MQLYIPLAGGVLLGWFLGYILPKSLPSRLGQFLFWIGVPIGISGDARFSPGLAAPPEDLGGFDQLGIAIATSPAVRELLA